MCDKNTELMITNYPKSVYNFSYYRQDGGPGIIGSNGRLECIVQKNIQIKSAIRLFDNSHQTANIKVL